MTQTPAGWPTSTNPYMNTGYPGSYRPGVDLTYPPLSYSALSQPPQVSRTDITAALDASNELGPDMRSEVIGSFVAEVNARMAADWQQRELQRQNDEHKATLNRRARTRDLVICLAFAIPLTGIASTAGIIGMAISWAGIAAVAVSLSLRRGDQTKNQHDS